MQNFIFKIVFLFFLVDPFQIDAKPFHFPVSSKEEALTYLHSVAFEKSEFWPAVNPQLFSNNLIKNIEDPVFLYAGRNTNFCGYAALSYYLIIEDPLGYAKFMTSLFKEGKANYGKALFSPSAAIRAFVGKVMYEGDLDQNDADQVLFFTLADHFKGYLNLFHHRYHPGAEQSIWAATNLSKFNRMLSQMLNREVHSIGSDLIRPNINDLPTFLNQKLLENVVFLYLNNTILRKKNHQKLKKRIPTHYIVLISIKEDHGIAMLTYWDAGFKTRRMISLSTLGKLVYGVSWTKKKQ